MSINKWSVPTGGTGMGGNSAETLQGGGGGGTPICTKL